MTEEKNVFRFNDPLDSPGYLLWQVTMAWQRAMKGHLDELGITHTQFVLLAALKWMSQKQKEVIQIEIARHAGVDRMMTSKILKSLAARGIVEARDAEQGSRARAIRLTPEGEALFLRAVNTVEGADAIFFSRLGEGQQDYLHLMRKLMHDPSNDPE